MKPLYFALAWLFFALGVLGAVLPGLPTVPFMLLALWAFSRSSRRFHDWLYTHRLFGPPLQDWQQHRVIPLRAKIFSLTSMVLSMAYMVLFAQMAPWTIAITAAVMAYGAWFILSHPSRPRS
jgi:uncharacterized membrane protein YbaN (DUF454 family)